MTCLQKLHAITAQKCLIGISTLVGTVLKEPPRMEILGGSKVKKPSVGGGGMEFFWNHTIRLLLITNVCIPG